MQNAPTSEARSVSALPPSPPDAPTIRALREKYPLIRTLRTGGVYAGILLAVAQTNLIQGYRVYGNCMEPNVCQGERLLGDRMSLLSGIHRGELVVFHPPHQPDQIFVKRVIALPGETVAIRHSRVYVNDQALSEPYLLRTWHDDRAPEVVRPGKVFVMGDNRDFSNDSREWGELPIENIIAKASFRYWPWKKIGFLR